VLFGIDNVRDLDPHVRVREMAMPLPGLTAVELISASGVARRVSSALNRMAYHPAGTEEDARPE
jgi:hypothetical protein